MKEEVDKILSMGRGPKELFKKSCPKSKIHKLRKEDGNITSNREEILNIC